MKSTLHDLQRFLKWSLLIILLAITTPISLHAQSVLFPGDIAITGFISADDGNVSQDDAFSFVLLRSIDSNTVIYFTDLGWTNAGKFQSAEPCGASTGSHFDGVISWRSTTTMQCGSQVRILCKTALTASTGVVTGITPTFNNSLNFLDLSSNGDQIFGFQGGASSPVVISGVSINRVWDADLDSCTFDSEQSMLPAGFGSFAPAIYPNAANARYNCSITNASSSNLMISLANNANWITDNTLIPPVPAVIQLPLPCNFTGCNVAGPQIIVNPVPTTICEGASTSFSITASGANYYQWQELLVGGIWVDLNNGGPWSGCNSSTLTVTNAPISINNTRVRCKVSGNGLPSAVSFSAVLIVNALPNLVAQTGDRQLCVGTSTGFSVSVNGASTLNFQWQTNTGTGGWVNLTNTPPFSGVNDPALAIANTPYSLNLHRYRCIISGPCGFPATSAPVTLFLNQLAEITSEPINANLCFGSDAEFSVSAIGAALTFRWQIDTGSGFTSLIGNGTPPIFGAANDTLFIDNPPATLNGARFRCIISGSCNSTDTSAICELRLASNPGPLVFSAGPTASCSGSPAALYTVSPITPATTYTWTYTGSGVTINQISPGAASVVFGSNATSGSLRVIASNSCATAPFAFRNVIISPTYSILDTVTICPGDSVQIFGVWRSAPGNYTATFTSVAGCDSAYIRTLSVATVYNQNNNLSICSGDSVFLGGAWRKTSGTYVDNLQSVNGCDSTINTNLTVFASYNVNNQTSICQGDSAFLQGAWQTAAGIYTDVYNTISNCDSVITTTLTVDSLPVVTCTLDSVVCIPALPLTLSGGTPAGGTWSGSNVAGGVFNTAVTGLYTINYTFSDPGTGCTAVATDFIEVRTCAGLSEFDTQGISIYPNPARNTLFINFSRPLAQDATYIITDINGRLVATSRIFNTQTQLDVENLEKGVYMLTLLNDGNRTSGRIVLID